jgi:hypothetical protein
MFLGLKVVLHTTFSHFQAQSYAFMSVSKVKVTLFFPKPSKMTIVFRTFARKILENGLYFTHRDEHEGLLGGCHRGRACHL